LNNNKSKQEEKGLNEEMGGNVTTSCHG
jgi:hypothetical protein